MPDDYVVSMFSGEEQDAAIADFRAGVVVLPSSTAGSTKKFKLTVNDSGTVSAVEVTT